MSGSPLYGPDSRSCPSLPFHPLLFIYFLSLLSFTVCYFLFIHGIDKRWELAFLSALMEILFVLDFAFFFFSLFGLCFVLDRLLSMGGFSLSFFFFFHSFIVHPLPSSTPFLFLCLSGPLDRPCVVWLCDGSEVNRWYGRI